MELPIERLSGRERRGSAGFAVVETDNPADLSDATSKFGFIADYQICPVVDIAESAQALQQGLDFRDAIS